MLAIRLLGAVAALILGGYAIGCCAFSGPRWEGPVTDHFDGAQFQNVPHEDHGGFARFLKWQLTAEPGVWPGFREMPPGPPPPRRVGPGEMRVTWVNHATVLVQMDGLNVLTDPQYSERASPVTFAGPRRRRPPGIRFEDLPPIDAVVVSHNHYDHCDLPTLARLAREHRPRFFVGLGNKALLVEQAGIAAETVEERDWWQTTTLTADVRVTSVPAQHFSQRGFCDRDATLWTGWVLEGAKGAVYFAGDTGWGPHFAEIGRRFPVRLALLPIGAYLPRWFMHHVHIDPQQAIEAHRALGAATSVAMHFGTFPLGDDGETDPERELLAALAEAGTPGPRFWILEHGAGRDVPER